MIEANPVSRKLVEAGSRVLARVGFDAFTLDLVATELGIAVADVEAVFPSTHALLCELVRMSFSDVADAAIEETRHAADGPEALTRFVRAWVLHYLGRLDEFRQVMMLRQIVGGERFGVGPEEMKTIIPHVGRAIDAVEAKLRTDGVRELPGGIDPRRLAFGSMVTAVGLLTIKGIAISSSTPLRHSDDAMLRDTSRALGASMTSVRQLAALNDAAAQLARVRSETQLRDVLPAMMCRVLGDVSATLTLRGEAHDSAENPRVSEVERALASGTTVLRDDAALAAVPVRYESRIEGVIVVGGRELDSGDVGRLETFATMVGIALENVRLYGDLQAQLDARTERLRDALVRLGETEKMAALGKLVAGVVHEVSSPAASVLSGEATLSKAVAKLRGAIESHDGSADRMLGIVEQSAANVGTGVRRLSEIVTRLKRFSRLDAAEIERIDLCAAIRDAIAVAEAESGTSGRTQARFGDVPEVLCYASRLNQVWLDVLRNAARAIGETGNVRVDVQPDGADGVRATIEDDGPGIGPDELARIFEPGFTTKDGRVRAGYGLATAYLVVRDHGGDIRVESERGRGTKVVIRVPLEPRAEEPE